jgi:hypothetical protein
MSRTLKAETSRLLFLSSIELPILKKHLRAIIAAIDSAVPGSFQAVDCGTFKR